MDLEGETSVLGGWILAVDHDTLEAYFAFKVRGRSPGGKHMPRRRERVKNAEAEGSMSLKPTE
jgi:hypothetical protein